MPYGSLSDLLALTGTKKRLKSGADSRSTTRNERQAMRADEKSGGDPAFFIREPELEDGPELH
jgi:hypothetical protein